MVVLRLLGLRPKEAARIANRPLPAIAAPQHAETGERDGAGGRHRSGAHHEARDLHPRQLHTDRRGHGRRHRRSRSRGAEPAARDGRRSSPAAPPRWPRAQAADERGGRASPRRRSARGAVLRPPKFLAIGLNYADHVAESGLEAPPFPIFFNKQSTCVTGPTRPDPPAARLAAPRLRGRARLRDRPALPPRAARARARGDRRLPRRERRERARLAAPHADHDDGQVVRHARPDRPVARHARRGRRPARASRCAPG